VLQQGEHLIAGKSIQRARSQLNIDNLLLL
jgi:hypothetical protein